VRLPLLKTALTTVKQFGYKLEDSRHDRDVPHLTFLGVMLAAALAVAAGTWFTERAVRTVRDVRQSQFH
jgi:hypothetical protein